MIQQVEQLQRSAQAQLGIAASRLAVGNWDGVNPVEGKGLAGWSSLVSAQVVELRDISGVVAQSAYQLSRWLETGYSLGEPLRGAETGVELARVFSEAVGVVAGLEGAAGDLGADLRAVSRRGGSPVQLSLDALADARAQFDSLPVPKGVVGVDAFRWGKLSPDITDDLSSLLSAGAQSKVASQVGSAKASLTGDALRDEFERIIANSGLRAAGLADKAVMSAGRDLVDDAARNDKRIKVWARGTSNNPCAFCAMLAANGFQHSVGLNFNSGTDQATDLDHEDLLRYIRSYHPNCHCFPIYRWRDDSELPKLNEYFAEMWGNVTSHVSSGAEKRRVWRRWLNAHKSSNGGVVNVNDSQEEH